MAPGRERVRLSAMNQRRRILRALALFAMPFVLSRRSRAQNGGAPEAGADEDPLAPLLWVKRPVIIFADDPGDPRLAHQLAELAREKAELEARDVVVIVDDRKPARRDQASALRRRFRPHGFTVIVLSKDGEVVKRHPDVLSAFDVMRLIDRLPRRLQEMGRG